MCFVLAAGASALIVFPNSTEPTEATSGASDSKPLARTNRERSRSGRPGEKTGDDAIARAEPPVTPDPSLTLDCKNFTSQGAAQKAFDQQLEDQDVLDPDADVTACEALDILEPEPKPEPEKNPKKEPGLGKRSESKKKPELGKEPASKKKPTREEEPEPEKKR